VAAWRGNTIRYGERLRSAAEAEGAGVDEEAWLTGTDPGLMLAYLRIRRAGERKLRLFALACCRRVADTIKAERVRQALDVAEQVADGRAEPAALAQAGATLAAGDHGAARAVFLFDPYVGARQSAEQAARFRLVAAGLGPAWSVYAAGADERAVQAGLLRDLFGNPFRPVAIDPRWLTPDVRQLAAVIHEEQAFDRMPVLGDALEEAGCVEPAVLEHCREGGEHVRGCWVVDGLTGRG
jgi:hypothetical protein